MVLPLGWLLGWDGEFEFNGIGTSLKAYYLDNGITRGALMSFEYNYREIFFKRNDTVIGGQSRGLT